MRRAVRVPGVAVPYLDVRTYVCPVERSIDQTGILNVCVYVFCDAVLASPN
jgi:hypothetical protein